MAFNTLELTTTPEKILTITLGRAEKFHALDAQMIAELEDVFCDIRPGTYRAVIISSDGPHFCAGGDLNWMKDQRQQDREGKKEQAGNLARMLNSINRCPCPVIARVQGNAFGGGVGLISVCDIAIVAEQARFALTEVKLGIIPATISPFVIARIGQNHARHYMLTAQMFSAHRALEIGLASYVCDEETLDSTLSEVTEAILKTGPEAVAATKSLIHTLSQTEADQHQHISIEALADTWERQEASDGVDAFFAKTPPPWVKKDLP